MDFGERLSTMRQVKDLSARRPTALAGVVPSTITRMREQADPVMGVRNALAEVLGVRRAPAARKRQTDQTEETEHMTTTPWRQVQAEALAAMTADERTAYDTAAAEEELKLQLAELVLAARTQAGLSQTELAARAGTRRSVISAIENGAHVPTVSMLARLARALGRSLHIDLTSTTAVSAQRNRDGLALASSSIAAAAPVRHESFAGPLRTPFPWMRYLSDAEQEMFAKEFVDLSRACSAVHQFDPLAIALSAWQSTAQAYASGVPRDGGDIEWLEDVTTVGTRDGNTAAGAGEALPL
jgi:transcriptional regulator with XRE-family HTH domain